MYIQGMAVQTRIFLMCIGFGFFLGIVFEAVKFAFLLFSCSKRSVLVSDIAGFLILTVLVFFFLLCVCSGEIRLYSLAGLLAGFLICYFTLGFMMNALALRLCHAISDIKKRFKNKLINKKNKNNL